MAYSGSVFHRHVAARNLSEVRAGSSTEIHCGHCATTWMRDREDGRRGTIADRNAAVEHLRQHAIYDPPREGE